MRRWQARRHVRLSVSSVLNWFGRGFERVWENRGARDPERGLGGNQELSLR